MTREEKLSHLYDVLGELEYPITREDAVGEVGEVRLLLADGTIELPDVIRDAGSHEFVDRDDLTIEIMSGLPRRAVGEPYQSEGEG